MVSHSLLQAIFLNQGLNQALLHGRQILYRLSHQGSLWSAGDFSPNFLHDLGRAPLPSVLSHLLCRVGASPWGCQLQHARRWRMNVTALGKPGFLVLVCPASVLDYREGWGEWPHVRKKPPGKEHSCVKGLGPGAQEDPLSPANRKAKARQSLSSETLLWSFSGSLGGEGQGAEPSSGRAQGRLCPLRPALKGSGGPLSLSLGQPRPGPHTLQLSGS